MKRELSLSQSPDDARMMLKRVVRNDFVSFIRQCFLTLVPGARYQAGWHIEGIAWHLEQVRSGAIKRLIITMPPRSLKSIATSVAFPAFVHGHDPTKEFICVSYAQDLAAKHHNDYRAILRSDWYREIFPNTEISPTKDTETETLLTQRGTRLATSTGGVLTGRGGGIIIIDDPLKPADAWSAAKRETVNAWFASTLMSRLNDKQTDAIVIVTQRLHSDDLVGHLLEKSAEDWTVLNLPAIASRDQRIAIGEGKFHLVRQGEVLHPVREPLHILEQTRRDIGSDIFAAQYLQEPVPPGGNMFKRTWVERYDRIPDAKLGETLQSWDTASKTGPENDWSVCTTWRVVDGRYYLIDVFRDRLDYPALRKKAIALAVQHNPRIVLVEDTNIGTGLAAELRLAGIGTKAIAVDQSKEARASIQAVKFEGGLVLLPERARWLAEFEAELFAFPGGRHDDQIDSMVQALSYDLRSGRVGLVAISY